ncbi:MAG: hypothetical protein KDD36_11095 [Flavobacteriales bacterium]|nr:hypothetical protein [Flavobacteriales bacterium]
MKTIMTFGLCLFLLALVPSRSMAQERGKTGNSSKNFELEINRKMTEQDIKDIQEDLKRRLIKLEFEELKFTPWGKFWSGKGTITFNDGAYGKFYGKGVKYIRITRSYDNSGRAGEIEITVK